MKTVEPLLTSVVEIYCEVVLIEAMVLLLMIPEAEIPREDIVDAGVKFVVFCMCVWDS